MERRGSNTWLVAALAIAVGFLGALLLFGGDDDADTTNATVEATTTTQTTTTATTGTDTTPQDNPGAEATPATPDASVANCIALWNQANNRGAQTFLVNIASQQPIRVHVGATTDVPPQCLITVIGNNGDAYTFPEGGGTTFPYAPAPSRIGSDELPAAQKTANALEEPDGRLKAR